MLPMYIGLDDVASAALMVAFDRDSARARPGGDKYFVLGALASGLLLYGMSMVYGATGTLEFSGGAGALQPDRQPDRADVRRRVPGRGYLLKTRRCPSTCGCLTSISAPTAVTLVIATALKLAAFAMAVRLLIWALFDIAGMADRC